MRSTGLGNGTLCGLSSHVNHVEDLDRVRIVNNARLSQFSPQPNERRGSSLVRPHLPHTKPSDLDSGFLST